MFWVMTQSRFVKNALALNRYILAYLLNKIYKKLVKRKMK